MEDNDWMRWRNHVLIEIGTLNLHLDGLEEDARRMDTEIAKLRIYAAGWGATAAIAVSIAAKFIIG